MTGVGISVRKRRKDLDEVAVDILVHLKFVAVVSRAGKTREETRCAMR